jgi:NDP-sugar pyrophosphorylase family protein
MSAHVSSSALPTVCILAGGLGTRLGPIVDSIPKPLVKVAGEPFLNHQLRRLSSEGATKVVLCVGYLGQMIEDTMGDRYNDVSIEYSYDGPGLDGTLGAIRRAASRLGSRFLVMYGDTYLRLDFGHFYSNWVLSGRLAGMTVLANDGRWDRSNASFASGLVRLYDKQNPTGSMRWIDYGLGGLSQECLQIVGPSESDLSVLYRALSLKGELFGYEVTERFYEIGSPDALAEASAFLAKDVETDRTSAKAPWMAAGSVEPPVTDRSVTG